MNNGRTRVVVTGLGALSPLGLSTDEFWQGLLEGRSGVETLTLCDPRPFPSQIGGEVKGFDPVTYMDAKQARRMGRFSQLAVAAAGAAIEDSGLRLSKEDPERIGVLLGNGSGGLPEIEQNVRTLAKKGGMRINPFLMPIMLPNMGAASVSRLFGLKGYTSTVATACASGTQALGEAAEVIRRGAADVMLSGGFEAGISQIGLGGFCVMRALSTRNDDPHKASRPFDAKRDGFVGSEGAGILVLESLEHALDRGASLLAEVVGHGVSSDAYHPVLPDEDGAGAARAIRFALADARVGPDEIDYINAHATSTQKNDRMETFAIKEVFGERAYDVPVSATKSMIGHALGGAGGLEAVVCVKTIQDDMIHPTINYEYPDPECDLDYVPNVARSARVDTVLSNSFGFGGQNACLILRRYED